MIVQSRRKCTLLFGLSVLAVLRLLYRFFSLHLQFSLKTSFSLLHLIDLPFVLNNFFFIVINLLDAYLLPVWQLLPFLSPSLYFFSHLLSFLTILSLLPVSPFRDPLNSVAPYFISHSFLHLRATISKPFSFPTNLKMNKSLNQ